jgi:outer membrane protein TolC
VSHDWSYQAGVTATWSFDLGRLGNIRAQNAALGAARARELRVLLATRDAIHHQWNAVAAGIARARSARVGHEAATRAAELAWQRYQAGAATQLDLLQAQRDEFAARVARIQSDADLANARLQLRLAAGIDPFSNPS